MTFKIKDYYYKKAKKENFLARSIYKLQEIDKKYKIFHKGNTVVDLGYHPGSWVQYASQKIAPNGYVLGIDTKPINSSLSKLDNVILFKKNVFSLDNLSDFNHMEAIDIILSDMAPNTTGIKNIDQARSLELVEKVFYFIERDLKKGGRTIVKVFDGHDARLFLKNQGKYFDKFYYFKPKSTKPSSKEFFFIGLGYRKYIDGTH